MLWYFRLAVCLPLRCSTIWNSLEESQFAVPSQTTTILVCQQVLNIYKTNKRDSSYHRHVKCIESTYFISLNNIHLLNSSISILFHYPFLFQNNLNIHGLCLYFFFICRTSAILQHTEVTVENWRVHCPAMVRNLGRRRESYVAMDKRGIRIYNYTVTNHTNVTKYNKIFRLLCLQCLSRSW